MQLYAYRSKTLLPRVDIISLVARILVLAGILWYAVLQHTPLLEPKLIVFVGLFIGHFVYFMLAIRGKFDVRHAYLASIVFDLAWIPFVVHLTGGINSSFYLWYFAIITSASYVLTPGLAALTILIGTLSYAAAVVTELQAGEYFDLITRLLFFWMYYSAIAYTAEYQRKSERRLLKLFDTLNARTAELEKSQTRLEVIYENSRVLASILDSDDVVREVIRILGTVLKYENCALILRTREGELFYRARIVDSHEHLLPMAAPTEELHLVQTVFAEGSPVRVGAIASRGDYMPLNPRSLSVLLVPMISHGVVTGVLVGESELPEGFRDRDMQLLSIVARSAALALDNALLHRQTEALTVVDELTDTYNYRFFTQKLQEEKRRALRYAVPLSLIMVDIDWFKKLNDAYGHEVGNAVLAELSRLIKRCIRDVDIFCRYGGEEFAIILPQTGLHEARRLAERIREQVESAVIETPHAGKLKITVSIGVTSFPENGQSQEELVNIADQALYQAKGEGRNLVCAR